jgi:tRNA G18 (ribose-2'-O)-methylase SpoU
MKTIRKLTYEEIQQTRPGLEEVKQTPRNPVVVLCDDIRSLHNVGAIFRTADGAHMEKIYLSGISGKPPRNEIRKTSLGAEESVPWEYVKDAADVISQLKEQGYQIVALEHTDSSGDYREAEYKFPLCLIVGHEFHGINYRIVEMSDMAIELPMHGIKQSLNVSVAFGIAVYEIVNKWEH